MNRLFAAEAPFTSWRRAETYAGFVRVGNAPTLALAIQQAQNMTPLGYIVARNG